MAQDYVQTDNSEELKIQDLKNIQGNRTQFKSDTYKVENLSYPNDLLGPAANSKSPSDGSTQYGNNYVVYYINVNESSKLLSNSSNTGDQIVSDWAPAQKDTLAGQNVTAVQAGTGVAFEGAIAGGAIKGDLGGAGMGAAIGVAGTALVASQTATFSKQMKRLKAAIALHTPNNLSARYSANYDDVSTSAFQMAMKAGVALGRALSENVDKLKNGDVKDMNVDVAKAAGGPIGAAIPLNMMPGKDSISSITGLAVNPKKEQVFRGVDFRTWQFDYQFFPRSKNEYQNIANIIYMFKLHMHPEYKDADNFLYIYPSEFDIVHYNGIDENLHLPRHTSCVLTDLTINYSPQSQFTSFEGGIPTQINITMTFKELVQMSKERIQEGY